MNRCLPSGLIFFFLFWGAGTPPCDSKDIATRFIEVEVKAVSVDSMNQSPVVLLSDREGKRVLPIWVGILEAAAMERELNHLSSKRPMTHDLFVSMLNQLQVKVEEVRIVDLKENTFYATLFLKFNQKRIELDSRPSDAIILALKSKSPIFVLARILEEHGILVSTRSFGERSGIRVQALTPSLASHFHFKEGKGVLVSEVFPAAASESSDIRPGDIITKLGQREIGGIEEFEAFFDSSPAGNWVRVRLFREGRFQEVNFKYKP